MAGQLKSKSLIDRILERCVERPETGCLLWAGWKLNGYGNIRWQGKRLYVHRSIYEDVHGPIPKGLCVCHACDTPTCVNPEHLFLGTIQENTADKVGKNRQSRGAAHARSGEKHHAVKLTELQVAEIRATKGATQAAMANKYGVSQSTISHIFTKRRWKEEPNGIDQ